MYLCKLPTISQKHHTIYQLAERKTWNYEKNSEKKGHSSKQLILHLRKTKSLDQCDSNKNSDIVVKILSAVDVVVVYRQKSNLSKM